LRELVKAGRGQDALEKFSKIVGGNLVQFMSWRQSFGETDESAAEIFSAFLDAATGPFSTTERLRPIVEATKKHGLKQAWDTMSTTLWALRPEDYLPIKISYFRRLADELEQPLPKGRPGVNNFYKVLGFVRALETALEELQPSDLIDIQAFIWVACMPEENPEEESGAASAEISEQARELQSEETAFPLNQILYGPPGTGKTYNTMETAVEIIDGDPPATPREIKMRFDQLVDHGRIGFVTFHQSYSYEDFVEGIRPVMDGENGNGAPRYECRDGIFKQLCRTAADTGEGVDGAAFDLDGRAFWKMSLGATDSREGDLVYEESIEKGFIAHGFGEQIDFTGCADKAAIQLRISAAELEEDGPFTAEAVDRLMHGMHVGDVVIVTYGNRKFRALGEITGEYEFRADAIYAQTRPVRWLRVFEEPQSKERLMKSKNFSQMTIYGIDASNLRLDALRTMLEGRSRSDEGAHVLIIDEINRANISKVLGELITLLEPDKRADGANALRVTLPYSQETFAVPSNLFLIGTMNTADKSIALVDLALRRRFVFTELLPDFSVCRQLPDAMRRVLEELNRRIALRKDRDHRIGHAYFMTVSDATTFKRVFGDHIVPLLQEYFYNDWDGLRFVLGEVDKKGEIIVELPGGDSRWARNSWCWYYEVGNDSIDFLSVLERNYRLSLDQVDEPI
jgi:5-methylcytosine-specific restriction protein B